MLSMFFNHLLQLNEITKQMISIQTPDEKISWTDVCMK